MRHFVKILLLVALSAGLMVGSALAYEIDEYIGAAPNHSSYVGKDLIGTVEMFEVQGFDVAFTGTTIPYMTLKIYSNYFDNIINYFKTELGDLFISTDGYDPVIPTEDDYFYNGEDWEYVIVLDNHLASPTSSSPGLANIYEVDDGTRTVGDTGGVILSYVADTSYIYREGQEVQYTTGTSDDLGDAAWFISDDKTYLSITVAMVGDFYDWWEPTETTMGFHWTMTCGF